MDHICSNQNRQSDSEKTRTIGRVGKKPPNITNSYKTLAMWHMKKIGVKEGLGVKIRRMVSLAKGRDSLLKKKE